MGRINSSHHFGLTKGAKSCKKKYAVFDIFTLKYMTTFFFDQNFFGSKFFFTQIFLDPILLG